MPLTTRPEAHPLPAFLRAPMEALLGADFSAVRVQLESAEARELGAHAFARGDTLHFAPGAWNPRTPAGWSVIAHELAHVVQQRMGRARPAASGDVVRDDTLEREAAAIGEAAAAMRLTRTQPLRPWFHDIPAAHVGPVAVQCLMKEDIFKTETKAEGKSESSDGAKSTETKSETKTETKASEPAKATKPA